MHERRRGRARGGKCSSCPFLRGAREECPFNGKIYFFSNVLFNIMETTNLTIKLENPCNLHRSYPKNTKEHHLHQLNKGRFCNTIASVALVHTSIQSD